MVHIGDQRKIHFIGIGGCSMNGLAQILVDRGFTVTGSDSAESPFTKALTEKGIPVYIGQRAENLGDAELVIYSAAIKPDNPERAAARERGIPELERSVALGQITERYHNVVGIAGAHGKTTITSMLALMAEKSDLDATVHVGGFVEAMGSGTRIGRHDLFITEACEYVESFLTLRPTVALINNIDDDHLDYYKDIDAITDAFRRFIALLPADGTFIACTDVARVRGLADEFTGNKLTYGMSAADYTPANIAYDALGNPAFDVVFRGKTLGRAELMVPGTHNIIDALGALAVGRLLGADIAPLLEALRDFRLAKRRFEYYGERNGIKVFHDYAHHPTEIRAVLEAAARYPHNRLFCVFQCNSYTRAKTLFSHNVTCFAAADRVFVPDIYPGREKDDGSVHATDMVRGILEGGGNAVYVPTFEEIRARIDEEARPGDLVLTVGSGDVYKQTLKLL